MLLLSPVWQAPAFVLPPFVSEECVVFSVLSLLPPRVSPLLEAGVLIIDVKVRKSLVVQRREKDTMVEKLNYYEHIQFGL